MSLHNTKSKLRAEGGFTIVELLIVVVVIAILAAITIVSYNGITTRANGSAAQGSASTLQKKVETYAADSTVGNYPLTLAALTASGNSWTTPVMWAAGNPAPTAAAPAQQVQYLVCGRATTGASPVPAPTGANVLSATGTAVTGARIAYWNYTAATPAVAYVDLGSGAGQVTVNSVIYNTTCVNPTS